jgi:hypothetical protein
VTAKRCKNWVRPNHKGTSKAENIKREKGRNPNLSMFSVFAFLCDQGVLTIARTAEHRTHHTTAKRKCACGALDNAQ